MFWVFISIGSGWWSGNQGEPIALCISTFRRYRIELIGRIWVEGACTSESEKYSRPQWVTQKFTQYQTQGIGLLRHPAKPGMSPNASVSYIPPRNLGRDCRDSGWNWTHRKFQRWPFRGACSASFLPHHRDIHHLLGRDCCRRDACCTCLHRRLRSHYCKTCLWTLGLFMRVEKSAVDRGSWGLIPQMPANELLCQVEEVEIDGKRHRYVFSHNRNSKCSRARMLDRLLRLPLFL